MSAARLSHSGRNIRFCLFALLPASMVGTAMWQHDWALPAATDLSAFSRYWIAVPCLILVAAALSSTVGFAFSAIAAAMILHFVPDNVEAVQIMMVASIGIQAYSVAGMYQTISWRKCVPFLIGGVGTIPVGIFLLLSVRPQTYIMVMGILLA